MIGNIMIIDAEEATVSKSGIPGRVLVQIESPDKEDVWKWILDELGKDEIQERLNNL